MPNHKSVEYVDSLWPFHFNFYTDTQTVHRLKSRIKHNENMFQLSIKRLKYLNFNLFLCLKETKILDSLSGN